MLAIQEKGMKASRELCGEEESCVQFWAPHLNKNRFEMEKV